MKTNLLKYASEIFQSSDLKNVIDPKKNLCVMFTNYNCRGYLGQPVLNDCEEFARNLTEHFNYKCVFICNADCKTARNLLIQMLSIPDKKVVFFYSGHGINVKDVNGDEKDGLDEAFCFRDANLVDDEFCRLVNTNLRCKHFICISDACHCGTIYDANKLRPELHDKVTYVSSCEDHQTSKQLAKNGVFTYNFWNCFDTKTKELNIKLINRRLSFFDQHMIIFPEYRKTVDF